MDQSLSSSSSQEVKRLGAGSGKIYETFDVKPDRHSLCSKRRKGLRKLKDKYAADPDPPPALRPAFPSQKSSLGPEQTRPVISISFDNISLYPVDPKKRYR